MPTEPMIEESIKCNILDAIQDVLIEGHVYVHGKRVEITGGGEHGDGTGTLVLDNGYVLDIAVTIRKRPKTKDKDN